MFKALIQPQSLALLSLWLLGLLSGSRLEAQSSEAVVSERFKWLQVNIGRTASPDNVIDEDDVRKYVLKQKDDPELVLAIQESTCFKGGSDVDTCLEGKAIESFGRADRNENRQLDPEEVKDFETTVIEGDVMIGDLLDGAPPLVSSGDPTEPSSLPNWLGTRVTVRRSFLDERGASDPATFAWTHFGGGDETLTTNQRRTRFDIQAAISTELGNRPLSFGAHWDLKPVLVVEGDVSTDGTLGRDTVTHRLGGQIYGESGIDDVVTAHFIDLTFDYRTDRDYRSEVLGATFQWTPNMPRLGVGMYQPLGPVFVRWRPYAGLTYGDVRDPGRIASLQQSDGFTNAFARVRLEAALGTRLIAAVEEQIVFELEEEDDDHTAFGASLRYLLDREGHMSLVLSYDEGEKPPLFQTKEQTKIALGIKF